MIYSFVILWFTRVKRLLDLKSLQNYPFLIDSLNMYYAFKQTTYQGLNIVIIRINGLYLYAFDLENFTCNIGLISYIRLYAFEV